MLENDQSAAAAGKRLRYIRQLAGLGRDDLAAKANVGKTSISYWEHATDTTGSMTSKSMAKILKSLYEAGVECSERWLRNGTGPAPRLLNASFQHSATGGFTRPANAFSVEEDNGVTMLLIANLSEEIKRFAALSHLAVIMKINNNGLYPALEMGDYVGGVWQASHKLEAEKLCILQINEKLMAGRVKPLPGEGFQISLASESNQDKANEIKQAGLEKIAPIVRVWR